MEGDAKGQVGGMEMPRTERERLADESRWWKCAGCGGRSNEDILKEEGGEGEEGKPEQMIPEELKFGFRDQMEGKKEEKIDKGKAKEVVSSPVPESGSVVPSTPQRGRRGQIAPATSQSFPAASVTAQTPQPAPTTIPLRTRPDGVPAWVDKAITGVVAALAVMLIKKILV